MDLGKDDNPKKIESELELDIEIEKNYTKKNIYYFHNSCTQYKFNFVASENKMKNSPKWYDDLERLDKIHKNRNSNLVIFGLTESIADTKKERDIDDVHSFFKLTKELMLINNERINTKMQWTIDETKRLNPRKETLGPAPLWIQLGGAKSQIMRNQILKAAKKLKQSSKFKNVAISPDLSVQQRIKLKEF